MQTALHDIVEKISHQGCRLICPARNCSPYFFRKIPVQCFRKLFAFLTWTAYSTGLYGSPSITGTCHTKIHFFISLYSFHFCQIYIDIFMVFTRFVTSSVSYTYKNRNNKHHYQNRNLQYKRIVRTTISVTFHYHHVIHKIHEIP